jgi:hypothetical protein
MRWTMRARAIGILATSLVTGLAAARLAPAAEPAGSEVLDLLQISALDRRRLVIGEIVSYPVSELSERELAVGLAVFVAAPASRVAEYLTSGQVIARDATIADFGIVPEPMATEPLPGTPLVKSEREEAGSLLDVAPGTRFNLSAAEMAALRALRETTASMAPVAMAEKVWDAYRGLLRERLQAYQQGGLAALAPYTRGGGAVTDPATELRLAVADIDRVGRAGPELHDTLLRYPAVQPPRLLHRFYWLKRRVQKRPDLSLLHQIVAAGPGPTVHIERYFYVGHSYNAAQIITGALTYQDGTVVFCTSRFSTDEVLGVGNQLKRSIGRTQLRDEMRKRLEGIRASLTRPPSTESP